MLAFWELQLCWIWDFLTFKFVHYDNWPSHTSQGHIYIAEAPPNFRMIFKVFINIFLADSFDQTLPQPSLSKKNMNERPCILVICCFVTEGDPLTKIFICVWFKNCCCKFQLLCLIFPPKYLNYMITKWFH